MGVDTDHSIQLFNKTNFFAPGEETAYAGQVVEFIRIDGGIDPVMVEFSDTSVTPSKTIATVNLLQGDKVAFQYFGGDIGFVPYDEGVQQDTGGGGNILPWDMTPAPSPVPACVYPMDASLAEIQAVDPWTNDVPVMTDNFQTATYTIQGGAPSDGWTVTCLPTLTPPGPITVDFSSGVKAFEFDYSVPTLATPATDEVVVYAYFGLYDVNYSSRLAGLILEVSIQDGVQITRLNVAKYTTPISSNVVVPNTGRISVVMDANTGTFSVISDAVGAITLSDNSYNPSTPCIFSLSFWETQDVNPLQAGKDISVSLITDLADMTGTYPPGTTSICEGVLAGDADLPSEAVAGSLLEVTVEGTYDSIPYYVGDMAVVLTDGTTVQKLAPSTNEVKQCIPMACSDETTDLTTGLKLTFRMPYAMTLTEVRASFTTFNLSAPSIVDIHCNGVSIFTLGNLLTIDPEEYSSVTGTPYVFSNDHLPDNSKIEVYLTDIGAGTPKGLKVYLIGVAE